MDVKEIEGSRSPAHVGNPFYVEPEVKDVSERASLLKQIVERMQSNPIPAEAPYLTREDLHARR
jgi:hypothetical protein